MKDEERRGMCLVGNKRYSGLTDIAVGENCA